MCTWSLSLLFITRRNEPPTRTSRVACAETTSPGHIHSRMPLGSIQASNTTSRGAGIRRRVTTRYRPSVELSMHCPFLGSLEFSCDINLQRIQALFPELAVMLQPPVGFSQRIWINPTVVLAAFDLTVYEASALQHHYM